MTQLTSAHLTKSLTMAAGACLFALFAGTSAARAQQTGFAQPPIPQPAVEDPAEPPSPEDQIRRELEKLKTLEMSQRRAKARELISKYPDSRASHLVRQYLEEMDLYDEAAQAQREVANRRKVVIREYWRQQIAAQLAHVPNYRVLPLVRITNITDQAVLYQIRGYGMDWTRPRFLEPGKTDEVNYPVEYRRITSEGLVQYSLTPGTDYVFRQEAPEELPKLFEASTAK